MLWIITNVNPKVFPEGPLNYVGRGHPGPRLVDSRRGIPAEAVKPFTQGWAESAREFTHEFRLLDDDGVIHFEGVCGNIAEATECDAFWPLGFGKAESGCTTLEYRKKGSKLDWEVL